MRLRIVGSKILIEKFDETIRGSKTTIFRYYDPESGKEFSFYSAIYPSIYGIRNVSIALNGTDKAKDGVIHLNKITPTLVRAIDAFNRKFNGITLTKRYL